MNNIIIEYIKNAKTIITDKLQLKPFYAELVESYSKSGFDNLIEYCYYLKTSKIGVCNYRDCNNKTKFISFKKGYRVGCCEDHTKRLNNIEKYGVENVMQHPDKKKKFKDSMIEKYGVAHALQSSEILNKMISTQIDNGGVGAANPQIKSSMTSTIKEKFGVDNIMHASHFKDKRDQTMIRKYGSEHALCNADINKKRIQTNIDRFGATHHMKSTGRKSKIMQDFIKEKIDKLADHVVPLFNVLDYTGINQQLEWSCVNCKSIFSDNLNNGKIPRCQVCNPLINVGYSKMETELVDILKDNFELILNDRTILDGKELDIYIPFKKVSIEFNGIFWHSELYGKNKNYHLDKTKKCNEQGINLIHIFETEWMEKKDLVISIIHSKLGKFEKRLYARNCDIREISPQIKNKFLEENHLQGSDKSTIKLGLFFEGELVSVMTFGNSRFNKNYQFEMHRFCNKKGHQIVGGASKLWSYFVRNYFPESVITYADRRYYGGSFYDTLGFTKVGASTPNYFYFKGKNKLLSRIQFQKHKLQNILETFDPTLTEWENMQLNGYNRIWDCGNYVFEWRKKETP